MVGEWMVRAGRREGREEPVEDREEGRRKRGWIRPHVREKCFGQLTMSREAAEKIMQVTDGPIRRLLTRALAISMRSYVPLDVYSSLGPRRLITERCCVLSTLASNTPSACV